MNKNYLSSTTKYKNSLFRFLFYWNVSNALRSFDFSNCQFESLSYFSRWNKVLFLLCIVCLITTVEEIPVFYLVPLDQPKLMDVD